MVANRQAMNLKGIARLLVQNDLLTEQAALELQATAQEKKKSLISVLLEEEAVPAKTVALYAAQEFGMPLLDMDVFETDSKVMKLVTIDAMKKHNAMPLFKRGNRLYVGIIDPMNVSALDEIKFATGLSTEGVIVEESKLVKAIDKAMDDTRGLDDAEDDLEDLDTLEVAGEEEEEEEAVDDAPVVRFINKVLLDAIRKGASDLHFEPYEKKYRVRFRIDGVLQEVSKPPLALSAKIAARIKVMARLDVSERRVPQDGRIKLKLSKTKAIDFRVNTCPTLFGEKTCMRILDSDAAALQIDQLGYEDFQKKVFLDNLHRPYGMFLVTGPTGSGKTVSLYTGINILNQIDVNICTAEDPVEINLPGVNQVQIDERTGMTFPKALKAFLRQDPDIILVGEIRDIETGGIAVKAAQTGHMVMSTLHTNDCPQTLTRLQDMGIAAFAVATSINVITAQRLCRRLHPDYRVVQDIPKDALLEEGFPEDWLEEGSFHLYTAGEGEEDCPSGFKGRAGVYQVMPITDALKRLIIEGANAVQLADQALSEGVWDIRKSALRKVLDGITSLEEVNRVTLE